jgi:hypothetical protein
VGEPVEVLSVERLTLGVDRLSQISEARACGTDPGPLLVRPRPLRGGYGVAAHSMSGGDTLRQSVSDGTAYRLLSLRGLYP